MPRDPVSFEAAVASSIDEEVHSRASALAELLGPLPNTVQPSRREIVDRWNVRSPEVPPGGELELAAEAYRMLQEKHQQEGTPMPDMDTAVKLVAAHVNRVLYPYRETAYGLGTPDPKSRISKAKLYARLAAERPAPAAAAAPGLMAGLPGVSPAPAAVPQPAPVVPSPAPVLPPPAEVLAAPLPPAMPAAVAGLTDLSPGGI